MAELIFSSILVFEIILSFLLPVNLYNHLKTNFIPQIVYSWSMCTHGLWSLHSTEIIFTDVIYYFSEQNEAHGCRCCCNLDPGLKEELRKRQNVFPSSSLERKTYISFTFSKLRKYTNRTDQLTQSMS